MTDGEHRSFRFEDGTFMGVVLVVTLLFAWLISSYFGAILWGLVAAILFEPATQRLAERLNGRKSLAAALVLLLILALIVMPALLLGSSLVQEAATLYERIRSGQLDIPNMLNHLRDALPTTVRRFVDRQGWSDFDSLRRMLGSGVANGLQDIASRALLVGQSALSFLAAMGVMLYLTFFLLRDGRRYGDLIRTALPLRTATRDRLIDHFVVVVRATMKGTVVVALVQGLLGGVIFWSLGIEGALLWGTMMGFLSLLPAVGTGIVWVPVAIYLLVSGAWIKGAIMIFCGVFVIGLVDNLLRPILVGRDTRMPDFVVLIATLSGLELFGLSGFIVGPVIAALFIAVWNMAIEQRAPAMAELATTVPDEDTPGRHA
ncbi:putative PurR-regulated permease PerM [Novosphingobium chloroacetimidivorans]|uniref:Putative PurR-regulated permease PerM n=1 Tax=Novosphingobium chloroacetimidivorans TaxID=1428314 RepID=A0A7W7KCG3_9SPHN|nr:AI-2E family transporter [Novosphingobium chloroacetimidivorans]MBB4859906.1 putative PurR-regulated permease PerM [Novosphingobium chloroacetimidivorans]